ncbi:MAG: AMP-binding protein, partial [bacterium]|nr:AMP-binding protein [bacterium]
MLGPCCEMITGILGVLKAGAAYLPINPGYPGERKRYLLEDAHARLLLTNSNFNDGLLYPQEVIDLDDRHIYTHHGHHDGQKEYSPGDLSYIIYTSGSTGLPKGVMVEHRNVVRLVKNTNFMEFRSSQGLLQSGALEFDASTVEIWGTLLNGLRLYLAPKEQLIAPGRLRELIEKYAVDIMWMSAPLFNRMVDSDIHVFAGLGTLLVGGDVLSAPHINQVRSRFPRLKIINGYGPTENTTFSTTYLINAEFKENIPIGMPIANSTAYIVDKYMEPVPIGIKGELVVGGDGVSRGYLNDAGLTASKFVSNPFIKGEIKGERLYKTGDFAQ